MNDATPEEYAVIESIPSGWHQIRDLPSGMRFRSNPGSRWKEWVVADAEAELFGERMPLIRCLNEPGRETHSCPGVTVWVD